VVKHNKKLQATLQTRPFFAVTAKAQKIDQARKAPELGVIFFRRTKVEKSDIQMSKGLYEYMLSASLREHDALRELREVTAKDPSAIMQLLSTPAFFQYFLPRFAHSELISQVIVILLSGIANATLSVLYPVYVPISKVFFAPSIFTSNAIN
jgi:hypothetical protein